MDMAVNPLNEQYRVHAGVVDADRDLVASVWRAAGLPSPGGPGLDSARYRWFYLQNPQGRARISFLWHEGSSEPIGFLGVGARTLLLGSEPIRAGALVDFVVDPRHRSLGPALKLQRAGRSDALAQVDCLYGLPAPQAVAICKRLEHQATVDLPRYARVIGAEKYLRRHLPVRLSAPLAWLSNALDAAWIALHLTFSGRRCEWIRDFDERFDRCWVQRSRPSAVTGLRDRAFLSWRFSEQPGHEYQTYVVMQPGSEELSAYFVCEKSGSALVIKDLLQSGSDRDLVAGLFGLAREARRMGLSTLSVEVTADEQMRRCLRKAQFSLRSTRPAFWTIGPAQRKRLEGIQYYITPADEDI